MNDRLAGIGLYTLPEAARLLQTEAREIRRWLFGYRYRARSAERAQPPLWRPQVDLPDVQAIGFRDLMELRFVKAFTSKGLSLRVVRAALENARELFGGVAYPFSNRRFLTDGARIYTRAVEEHGSDALIDLARRQLAFGNVIRPALYDSVEFDEAGVARRWYPLPRSRAVVLDPEIAFGQPVVDSLGVPTAAFADAVASGANRAEVARMFEVPVAAVDAALRFEQRFAH